MVGQPEGAFEVYFRQRDDEKSHLGKLALGNALRAAWQGPRAERLGADSALYGTPFATA